MLSSIDLKKYYVEMYEELRNYIWDFPTVEYLAELEVAVFQRFPDITTVRTCFNRLHDCIRQICFEDEYLEEAVKNFKDLIYSSDEIYSRIIQPKEV
jgi:hypothetical protein